MKSLILFSGLILVTLGGFLRFESIAQDEPATVAPLDELADEPVSDESSPSAPDDTPPDLLQSPATNEETAGKIEESLVPGDIPKAYGAQRYEAAWEKNPFLLKTAVVEQKRESFARDWALAGISSYGGDYRVTIFNKQTGDYKRLKADDEGSDSPDDFRLVAVNYHKDRNESFVEVSRGSETAELRYDEALLSRPVTVQQPTQPKSTGASGDRRGSPPVPGQIVPGRPGQPLGQPGARGDDRGRGDPRGRGVLPTANGRGSPSGGDYPRVPDQGRGGPSPGQGGAGIPANPGAAPTNPSVLPSSRRRALIPAPISQ